MKDFFSLVNEYEMLAQMATADYRDKVAEQKALNEVSEQLPVLRSKLYTVTTKESLSGSEAAIFANVLYKCTGLEKLVNAEQSRANSPSPTQGLGFGFWALPASGTPVKSTVPKI